MPTHARAMPESPDQTAPAGEIARLADHLFRQEAGKLVSVLTGLFGLDRLQLAEDVVQEALIRALQTWPFYGVPANPAAWLTQTAKNLALDILRREKRFQDKQSQIVATIENWVSEPENTPAFDHEIKDGRLRLMFACCHPQIPPESQTALALKTLCGFSPAEIASAFLTTEAAIAKRLTRARQRIHELKLPFEIPSGPDAAPRLEAVLQTLYLLFNEGYKASGGETLIREELCAEAIRLASLLAGEPVGHQPRTHALLALMLLSAARLPARTDAEGRLVRLQDQDRSRWNRAFIARGLAHLTQSAAGEEVTVYHLQAAISACHCAAPDFASTDWPRILSIYDRLVELDDSPVIALNRAVAVCQVHGPAQAMASLEPLRHPLQSYYLLHAALAEFKAQLHDPSAAADLEKAIQLAGQKIEQTFLSEKLRQLTPAPREFSDSL